MGKFLGIVCGIVFYLGSSQPGFCGKRSFELLNTEASFLKIHPQSDGGRIVESHKLTRDGYRYHDRLLFKDGAFLTRKRTKYYPDGRFSESITDYHPDQSRTVHKERVVPGGLRVFSSYTKVGKKKIAVQQGLDD